MQKVTLVVGTVLATSAIWFAVAATTGLGARTNYQTYQIGVNDLANFPLADLDCAQLAISGGYVVDCTRTGASVTGKYVTFTGGKINVWGEQRTSATCCKVLLFSTPRNP
jgi:hypothetical protein